MIRSANWAEQHNIYHSVSPTIVEMDTEIATILEKLASRSSDALALIKKVSWEGTEHFTELSPERIHMRAQVLF